MKKEVIEDQNRCPEMFVLKFIHLFHRLSLQELNPGLSALHLHTVLSKRDYLLPEFPAERRGGAATRHATSGNL